MYDVDVRTINEHIKKIYSDSELEEDSTIRNFRIVQTEGSRQVTRDTKHYTRDVYNGNDKIHRNIVFADTLEVIENIVLFSISNYFLRFSNEFRRIKGDDELDANNWYEYVEYGTTNPLTILLQRNGFSRESARFIKENPEYVVKDGSTGKLKLKASLSKCGRTSVENEVEYIRQNIPGIFVDEED